MFKRRSISIFLSCLLSIFLPCFYGWGYAEPDSENTSTPTPHAEEDINAETPETQHEERRLQAEVSEDALLKNIRHLTWQPIPEGAEAISLQETFKQVLESNHNLRQAQEKIHETEARAKHASTLGLLVLFRYFNPSNMEGTETSDVKAATAHKEYVLQKVLLESAEGYYKLMQAYLNQYLKRHDLRQIEKRLVLEEERFSAGETTSIDVGKVKSELVQGYQAFLQAGQQTWDASYLLSQKMGQQDTQLWFPRDLHFHGPELEVLPITSDFQEISREELVQTAIENRPELLELKARIDSLEHQIKTAPFGTPEVEHEIARSLLKQLKIQQENLSTGIRASTLQALDNWKLANENIRLAAYQRDLANTMRSQVQISYGAGFSSQKDVLDAEVTYAQAQVLYANAIIQRNLSYLRLMYETGRLGQQPLMGPNLTQTPAHPQAKDTLVQAVPGH